MVGKIMELLKAYPKDITLVIEIPLHELELFLDYLHIIDVNFEESGSKDNQFVVNNFIELRKSFTQMCKSVRNFENVS
jgi:hypothetical protein